MKHCLSCVGIGQAELRVTQVLRRAPDGTLGMSVRVTVVVSCPTSNGFES